MHDLALIKLVPDADGSVKPHARTPLAFRARTQAVARGERIFSLGYPLDVGFAPWIAAQAPELMQSVAWARLQGWIEQWGLAAMLLWLALPLPQVPFVLLAALLHVPSWAIFVAFVFGKGLKYAVEAYAAATGAQAVSTLWRRWLT